MYFAVGGRNTQSGLYRVTYDGNEPTAAAGPARSRGGCYRGPRPAAQARGVPRHAGPKAVEAAWPYLGHPDRFIRWAARRGDRVAGPVASWREKALAETSSPEAALNALLALTHVSAQRPGAPAARMTRRPTRPSATGSWRRSTGSPGTILGHAARSSTCCASTRWS